MSILKKIFFFSVFILSISVLFWGVYNLSFKKDTGVAENDTSDSAPITTPAISNDKISAISKEAIISPTLSADKNSIEYLTQKNGQVIQTDFYGQSEKIVSSEKITGLNNAFWSLDKTKLILQKKDGDFTYLNLETKELSPLKKNLDQVVWQTNANRILYKYYNPETKERTLNVADPNGANWTKLADLDYKNLSIAQIPRTGLISFWNSGDAYLQTNFRSIPVTGGEVQMINSRDFGADYLWSPDGNWVLVAHSDENGGFKMNLGIMNYSGGEYKNLDVPTFTSKCAWSKDGKTIFYALPGNIPENSVLPNDYKAGKFQTTDTFWKVDVKTGKKTRLIDVKNIPNQIDADQLFLNSSESLLFFVNKVDGKLYKITF